ncbi:PIG-L family deacetylase [Jatrophihabitans telluris]|uniref:PIG-L family deacetylase n=1 Tax=Jatrophihabitans telluris TaxID=2038343 RepID=A0ABY4QZM0_9ACTN|nr:PIG-L family deacetylase [Jatrophihabitans telluris]UQX88446.1 PIG-L family deacetylase [Jatrophihabitans telluris]
MSLTMVCFHAHPDDEALLTGGTVAMAVAAGHRVVLVMATNGEQGLAEPGVASAPDAPALGARRRTELQASAALLGCHRVVELGYPDSGMHAEHGGFSTVPVEDIARRLADILTAEAADVLTTYDARGGYGHPDHLQVHRAGVLAAHLAGTPTVAEATVDRSRLVRAARWLERLRIMPGTVSADRLARSYADPAEITDRVDVRRFARAKRAAMRAHVSQAGGGDNVRTLALLGRLPLPLFRLVCGTEWFIVSGSPAILRSGQQPLDG